jgi:hypothetical protein
MDSTVWIDDPLWPSDQAPAIGKVVSFHRNFNDLNYELDIQEPGLFAIADTWFPGWKAFLTETKSVTESETEMEIYRVNHAFKGVIVPKGKVRLKLTFSRN